ncbi:hypothetical protein Tco_1258960, partial [Tanacetum coccineum]
MINKFLTRKATSYDRPRHHMLQLLWGMVTGNNVDFANLIWEEFKYQIESKRVSKQKWELMPFSRVLLRVKIAVERVSIPKRRRSKTMVEEVGQSEEVADEADSEETKEDDEEPLNKRKITGLVIGGEGRRESDEEGVDHSKKLKGLETLSEVVQFKLNMKKARKASKHDFFIQSRPRGSGEGSGVTLEVPNELTLKSSNKGAGVTPEVLDESSDHYSSSSSDSDFVVEDVLSDEADVTEKADEAKKVETEKYTYEQLTEEHVTEKQVGEEEHGDGQGGTEQAGDTHDRTTDVTVNEVLKDPLEPEVQSMVDVPVNQAIWLNKDFHLLIQPVARLEKKVHAMSSFNLLDVIDKSVTAHLKKVLPADVPDISKIKMGKETKKSMPKYSFKPFDQASLDEFDQKDKLFQIMSKSMSYNKHPAHKALFDAIALSLSVDEDDMDKQLEDQLTQKKRRRDDQDQFTSSKKGTTPSKPSKLDKSVQAEETVEDLDHEEAMDDEEPVVNEVVNNEGHLQ